MRNARVAGVAAALAAAAWACGGDGVAASAEINLVDALARAERRAPGDLTRAVRLEVAGPRADRRAALVIAAPARVIWLERIGAHAHLRTSVVLVPDAAPGPGVTLRVGMSDERYEMLWSQHFSVAEAWQPVDVDLSAYGGWQWSLFYRPWNTVWRVNLSVDAAPHGAVALDRPRIVW